MKERNANLDVFRCLIMFFVVLGHVYKNGLFFQTDKTLHLLFQTFTIWHVDAFLSLSGWFGIKFSLQKFLRLWGIVAFYSVCSILVGRCLLHQPTRLGISGGWYGNTYLCLMLIIPILNAGIEGVVTKGVRFAWLTWLGFAMVMFVNWVSGNSYVSLIAYDIAPFTLVQMVFIYMTVRLFRLTDIVSRVKFWQIAISVICFIGCSLVVRGGRTNYIAPYVVLMALAMFVLFERYIKLPLWIQKVSVWMAPSMFGVYLLHETTSFGVEFQRVALKWLASHGVPASASILLGSVVCFGICLVLDASRRVTLYLFDMGREALCARH